MMDGLRKAMLILIGLTLLAQIAQAEPQIGSKPWVTILVRFADSPELTPHPLGWYESLMGADFPGMDHYFREASYGLMDLKGSMVLGWYNLPFPKDHYLKTNTLSEVSIDVTKVLPDAVAVADADVFFPQFYGINVMLNDNIGGTGVNRVGTGNGGKWTPISPVDGIIKTYGITVQKPPTGPNAHEMGHAFGLDHSSGPYFPDELAFGPHTYDSLWDVMSIGGDCAPLNPEYGCVPVHYNSYHKELLGWIPTSRKYVATAGSTNMIAIQRLAQPSGDGFLMGKIFIGGWATRFYTVEVRQRAGYDGKSLPGEGVVIHAVDTTRTDRQSQVIDNDNNGNPNDAGAIWTTGETFIDSTNGITVSVGAANATGFLVTISVAASTAKPHIVTNTRDTGPGSLRNAIDWANANPGTAIQFQIPGSDSGYSNGVFIIRPTNSLAALIGNGTVIDGTTQAAFSGDSNRDGLEIVIEGSQAGGFGNGLQVVASNCTIKNLTINLFQQSGIWLNGASNVTVQGCHLGTSADGTLALPNNAGLWIGSGSKNCTIGGTTTGSGNLISGNRGINLEVTDPGTSGNQILGNIIGLNRSGTAALSNGWVGLQIRLGASNNRVGDGSNVGRNTISGNAVAGIWLGNAGTTNNHIWGNYVGTDRSGTLRVPNGTQGILISDGAKNNQISEGNVISGNTQDGVGILNVGTSGNIVSGNIIGADASGSVALANGFQGVFILGGATDNVIGGSRPSARNIISGNRLNGIWISDAGTRGNRIQGNYIGTTITGDQTLANGTRGIILLRGAQNNVIGLTIDGEGAGNRIAYNLFEQILVQDEQTVQNTIRGNEIFASQRASINLAGGIEDSFGATANHAGVAAGPNHLQNHPVPTEAWNFGGSSLVRGTLVAAANRNYALDFFTSSSALFSAGSKYIGALSTFIGPEGSTTFALAIPGDFTGDWFKITATDLVTGDTSEFSPPIQSKLGADTSPLPKLNGITSSKNGTLDLSLSVEINRQYRLQTSTDLVFWQDLSAIVSGQPDIHYFVSANLPHQFYRLVSP